MANLEFCCNPFKERNHKPAAWRILPITQSLREQFRLYLGDETDICLSCKRKLYRTLLPDLENEVSLHNDTYSDEFQDGHWNDNVMKESYDLDNCDYFSTEKSAKGRQTNLRQLQYEYNNLSEISRIECREKFISTGLNVSCPNKENRES